MPRAQIAYPFVRLAGRVRGAGDHHVGADTTDLHALDRRVPGRHITGRVDVQSAPGAVRAAGLDHRPGHQAEHFLHVGAVLDVDVRNAEAVAADDRPTGGREAVVPG